MFKAIVKFCFPFSYWRLLRQPTVAFRGLRLSGGGGMALAWPIVGGYCMSLLWADVWNLGSHFEQGELLSVVLLVGPFVGICNFLLTSVGTLLMASLFIPKPSIALKLHAHIPPFPLKNLLWRRLLGTGRLETIFSWPILRSIDRGWSWLLAQMQRMTARFDSSQTGLNSILAWKSATQRAWLPVLLLLWAAHFIFDQLIFVPGPAWQWIWFILPFPLIGLMAYHAKIAVQATTKLGSALTWMILCLASILSLSFIVFMLSFVMGISLF